MNVEAQRHWDRMYARQDPSHAPRPHPHLAAELTGKVPGAALELGCGVGANAVWLATQGWTVTAVDISRVALQRAAAHARAAGVAARVRWERADLRDWTTTETFDLAAAFYLHTPLQLDYPTTLRRAARQVRPGGALLIVGHHEQPPWGSHPGTREGFASAADLASELSLDDREWTIKRADRVERSVIHDGRRQSVVDTVLYATLSDARLDEEELRRGQRPQPRRNDAVAVVAGRRALAAGRSKPLHLRAEARMPFGHRHREQEEVYVVVAGSGRMKAGDELVEIAEWK